MIHGYGAAAGRRGPLPLRPSSRLRRGGRASRYVYLRWRRLTEGEGSTPFSSVRRRTASNRVGVGYRPGPVGPVGAPPSLPLSPDQGLLCPGESFRNRCRNMRERKRYWGGGGGGGLRA